MHGQRYAVVQWGTGHTGMRSLRTVIEHPQYDLVGVRVYSDEKIGRDAGDLCGVGSTGVLATSDIEAIVTAHPDCVLYMPLLDHESIDDLCLLLETGVNVVTTVPGFFHPPTMDSTVRQRLEGACRRGDSSFYGTGPGPGFITEDLPLTLLRLERHLDRLSIVQFADLSDRQSPDFMAQTFGLDPADAPRSRPATHLGLADGAGLRLVGDAIGLPIDEVTRSVSWALATKTVEIGVATIEAGTVGAWQIQVTGLRDGKPLLEFRRTLYVTRDLDPALEIRDATWHLVVDGDAPLEVEIHFARENYGPISPGYNAHIAVNAVPAVCDAPPGIRTTDELLIVPTFG
jgi:2,4-diaminopentanoate dehydrogenase